MLCPLKIPPLLQYLFTRGSVLSSLCIWMNGPSDKKYVYVKKSTVNEAGEGLFAARNIPKDICIAQYVGHILDKEQNQIDWQKTEQDILHDLDSNDFNKKVMELNSYRM